MSCRICSIRRCWQSRLRQGGRQPKRRRAPAGAGRLALSHRWLAGCLLFGRVTVSLAEIDFFDWERLVAHYRPQVAGATTP
jgi:hypothetical protein